MEVLTDSDSPVLISNAEILHLLRTQITKRNDKNKKEQHQQQRRRNNDNTFAHRDWIQEQVHAYLQTTPCDTIVNLSKLKELKSKFMASKKVRTSATGGGDTNSKTTGFHLTEAESIQLLNFMPREPVEIHLMVEELHARMSDKRQEELLELIGSYMKDAPVVAVAAKGTPKDDDGDGVVVEDML
jgi:hypothetical protein